MTIEEKMVLAQRAARASGEMLRKNHGFHARKKGFHDFVTDMDEASERCIREILLGACPEDGFYGEEFGGTESAQGRWIVDPIDGTMNFIKGLPTYSISIAYEQNGELVLGCVYLPAMDEMYVGIRGKGAWLNGMPIHVSEQDELGLSVVSMSFSHCIPENQARVMRILPKAASSVTDMRRFASAAVDLCYTACGKVDGYFELGLHLHDYAAGIVILREAGGTVTGWKTDEDGIRTGNILASNGLLHEALRQVLTEE